MLPYSTRSERSYLNQTGIPLNSEIRGSSGTKNRASPEPARLCSRVWNQRSQLGRRLGCATTTHSTAAEQTMGCCYVLLPSGTVFGLYFACRGVVGDGMGWEESTTLPECLSRQVRAGKGNVGSSPAGHGVELCAHHLVLLSLSSNGQLGSAAG